MRISSRPRNACTIRSATHENFYTADFFDDESRWDPQSKNEDFMIRCMKVDHDDRRWRHLQQEGKEGNKSNREKIKMDKWVLGEWSSLSSIV